VLQVGSEQEDYVLEADRPKAMGLDLEAGAKRTEEAAEMLQRVFEEHFLEEKPKTTAAVTTQAASCALHRTPRSSSQIGLEETPPPVWINRKI
jgi:hypothetical protein